MKIKKVRCKRDYRFLKPGAVVAAVAKIKNGVYSHPVYFPDPGITEEDYSKLINDYLEVYANYKGHTNPMSVVKTSLKKLMDATDLLADYVDKQAKNDAILISAAGFKPTLEYVGQKNIPGQCRVTVKSGHSFELRTNCEKVLYADYYIALLTDTPLPSGRTYVMNGKISSRNLQGINYELDIKKARKKSFTGLKAGAYYYVYYWACNASGAGAMSEAVKMMALN